MPLGALFTTFNGEPIKNIPSGDMFLDFRNGTATDSAGTITLMNSNLDYYNLNQTLNLCTKNTETTKRSISLSR